MRVRIRRAGLCVQCLKQMSQNLMKESVHGPFERHLRETALHTNLYEHRLSPPNFIVRVSLFGILGVLMGGLFNALLKYVDTESDNRWKCGGFAALQIGIVAALFWAISWFLGPTIDDWVMATWSGFLFALTFFASQTHLNANIQCTVK